MSVLNMIDLNLRDKRVLIREDLNVPLDEQGNITSTNRIEAAIPTIQAALQQNAKIIVMSHLGRPKEGSFDAKLSLAPVAKSLSSFLNIPVRFVQKINEAESVSSGEVVLLENVRFNVGEKSNAPELAKRYAGICDIFVMDAFATAHRAEASTVGVAQFAPQACAGLLLNLELNALSLILTKPKKPMVAIIGGSKISTKVQVLEALSQKVDSLIVGGGIANTFIAASGISVGKSLVEQDQIDVAKKIMKKIHVPIPEDVVVASEFDKNATARIKATTDVDSDDMILDIGPKTAEQYASIISEAQTLVWNGPVGVFEWPQFSAGTKRVAEAVANSKAFSVAGGGDTIAALEQFGLSDQISYISTGGGAFLEWLEGKVLPGVQVLEDKCKKI